MRMRMFGFLPAAPELGDGESAAATDPTTPSSAAAVIRATSSYGITFVSFFGFSVVIWFGLRRDR